MSVSMAIDRGRITMRLESFLIDWLDEQAKELSGNRTMAARAILMSAYRAKVRVENPVEPNLQFENAINDLSRSAALV